MDDEEHVDGRMIVQDTDASDEDESQNQDEKQRMINDGRRNSSPGVQPSPMTKANIFSKYVSFWWLNPLLSLGSKRPLVAEDFYHLTSDNTTEIIGDQLQRAWDEQLYQAKDGKQPSLVKAIARTFGLGYVCLALFPLIVDSLRILQPILLGILVSYFTEDSTMSMRDAFLYALGVSLCSIVGSFFMAPFTFLRQQYGMRVRIACTAVIYNKVLKLGLAAMAKTSTGNIVNLVSLDTQRFDLACYFLHYIVLGPLEALVVLVLLWKQIGPSSLVGMGVLFLLVPMQIKMGDILLYFWRQTTQWVDERVKVMNEIISGIRVIKMYTWEESFTKWLGKIRLTELSWFRRMAYLQGAFMSFFFSSSALISFVTFLTYVLLGNTLTAEKVFTCTALFSSVRIVMALLFPVAITFLNESRVSVERMEKLLTLDEMHSDGLITSKLRPKPHDCGIVAHAVQACWTEEVTKPTLNNLSFDVGEGELLAVIGPVGAGKSSLLMAILGELPLSQGTINVKGKIGYASQQAWIYNGSLRQNVIFSREFDQSRYNEVIKVCALEKDIELLSDGDMTLVGERGVSLSGGQRARINLARAVYADADVYLLDDPLSAVDASVGRHLFDNCINGYLSNKPRILVTHQLQYLKEADELIALSEGECIGKGTYQELAKSGVDFMSLLAEEEEEDESASEIESETARPILKPQMSRQFSRQDSSTVKHPHSSSHRFSQMLESTMSMASEMIDTYEENILPKETKQEGAVTKDTYLRYMKAMHSGVAAIFVIFLFIVTQVTFMMSDWWLSYWCNKEEQYQIQSAQAAQNATRDSSPQDLNRDMYLGVYAALVASLLVLTAIRTQLFFRLAVVASRNLHARMFAVIMRAPSFFFDTNSIGRILNRFSKDIGSVDDSMPFTVCDFLQTACIVLGILALVAGNNPATFAVAVPITILFWLLRSYYMKTSREVKRVEGISRSPLFGHFSTTLLGLDTIRAFGAETTFTEQMHVYQDAHTRAWFTFIASSGWFAWRMDLLCVVFITFVALVSPALKSSLSAGVVGLTLSYAVRIPGVFQLCIRRSAELENLMTSVERVLEYCDLESEAPQETDIKPPPEWPSKGQISFENMSFTYHRSLPQVLHKISCCIKPREKIGVVGRTGAGKSSLLSTLFRLAEPSGLIEIDGMNIQELGLKDLRSKLSIIPQEPVLFRGTMRRNIDPFDEHKDTELWQVLDEVQLKQTVEGLPGKMDTELTESGTNFSVGQRQLVCLARAILRHSKILVIDEATANVDPRTDLLIQTKIRQKFNMCTVLTIAHRLHTIMDSDRVMVLEAGCLKEFDAPYSLLKNPRTLFSQLVNQTGPDEAKRLYEVARESFYKQKSILEAEEENEEEDDEKLGNRTEEDGPTVQVAVVVENATSPSSLQFETNI